MKLTFAINDHIFSHRKMNQMTTKINLITLHQMDNNDEQNTETRKQIISNVMFIDIIYAHHNMLI
jgi:hypothetical protein